VIALAVLPAWGLAHQSGTSVGPTSADLDLWKAIFGQPGSKYAVLNETLPSSWIRGTPADLKERSDAELVVRMLRRNEVSVALSAELLAPLNLPIVDIQSVQKATASADRAREFDYDAIRTQFGQKGLKVIRVSLPAFSDDGNRVALYYWWCGGFDDAGGGGQILQRQQGRWVTIAGFGVWIT
jgi:hypothetical protein